MIERPTILFGDRDQYVEKPLDAVLRVYPDFVARCPCLGTAGSDVDCNNTSFKIGLKRLCADRFECGIPGRLRIRRRRIPPRRVGHAAGRSAIGRGV